MNKQEAAEFLGVSVRAIERYVSAGKLPANYVRGKTGQVLDFDAGDLERFKAELEAPVSRGTIEPDKTRQGAPQATTRAATRPGTATRADSTALARLDGPNAQNALSLLVQAIADNSGKARQAPTVAPENKLMLTIEEAVAFSGIGRSAIDAAIKSGKLTAHSGYGRGRRVKRADLESYIGNL